VSHRAIMTVMSHDAESSNEMMTYQNINGYFDYPRVKFYLS
jgi:hypothetical protein